MIDILLNQSKPKQPKPNKDVDLNPPLWLSDAESTASLEITEVKLRLAYSVLRWVTT